MQFYCAPMEGLTGYIYRNAHHALFGNVDKYFSPFIAANQSERLKTRELNDVLPEHNQGLTLVPQLLTNKASDFIHTAKKLALMGYEEINLNLGCPSGTVVSKHRGAGFLAKRVELAAFLDEIFAQLTIRISLKIRIGKDQPEEFYDLIEIFNQYPVAELIIHPRVQKDLYRGKPNLKIFGEALVLSKHPVCYNGDIFTIKDYQALLAEFPSVDTIMLGRGLLTNPGLTGEIRNGLRVEKGLLKEFHDRLYAGYQEVLFGDKNVLFKMKALWQYMIPLFPDSAKHAKLIRKSERLRDYDEAVARLFQERDISVDENAQPSWPAL